MAEAAPIPVFKSLADAFPDAEIRIKQSARYTKLAEAFQDHFGKQPAFIIRAPGRVNLIGEHIDYQLFGCFPAAIERDILIAVAATESSDPGRVTAQNQDSKYTRQTFAPVKSESQEWTLDIDKTQLRWESYVKAGYYGVLERFFTNKSDVPRGLDLLVTGSVPAGSGLSSSAAMVVASTLSFLAVNGKLDGITKGDLVRMAMKNETRVGVNSGGLDQSSSVISDLDSALYISFYPSLSAELIPLPLTSPRSVFVCANSLVVSDKVVHSKTRYNLRVVETLAAARVLAHKLGVGIGKTERLTLREFLDRWMKARVSETPKQTQVEDVASLKKGLLEIQEHLGLLKLVESDGSDGTEVGLTLDEMISLSGMTSEEFKDVYFFLDVEATHFQLYKRAKHVFSEALRVLEFRDVCLRQSESKSESGNAFAADAASVSRELGRLMDESHVSCSTLCENSCPEVDMLCRLAKEAGAYGSRVTGAGWGGCTVSLVDEALVPEFIEKIKAGYPAYHGLHGTELEEVIFPTKPSSGASVYKLPWA